MWVKIEKALWRVRQTSVKSLRYWRIKTKWKIRLMCLINQFSFTLGLTYARARYITCAYIFFGFFCYVDFFPKFYHLQCHNSRVMYKTTKLHKGKAFLKCDQKYFLYLTTCICDRNVKSSIGLLKLVTEQISQRFLFFSEIFLPSQSAKLMKEKEIKKIRTMITKILDFGF